MPHRTAIFVSVSLVLYACGGPVGPFPGRSLAGSVEELPDLGSLPAEVETVQLETRPSDPYSVNIWWLVQDGRIYVPTSLILGGEEPGERQWVKNVQADPRVRLRVENRVYELEALRVDDPEERDAARRALLAKYQEDLDAHAQKAWIFRLEPR